MPGIVLELVLVFSAVFGFGFYELYMLRRDRKRDQAKKLAEQNEDDSSVGTRDE